MRNPVCSETDAFRVALGSRALIAASAAGALVSPVAGGALSATGLGAAFVWELTTKDRSIAAEQGEGPLPPLRRVRGGRRERL